MNGPKFSGNFQDGKIVFHFHVQKYEENTLKAV